VLLFTVTEMRFIIIIHRNISRYQANELLRVDNASCNLSAIFWPTLCMYTD